MNKKQLIISTTLTLILLFSSVGFAQDSKETDFGFRKTRWGMTKKQVKANESLKPTGESDALIAYGGSIANMANTSISYIFADGKLVEGFYRFNAKHTNKNDNISNYKKLKEILTRKYGEPTKDDVIWNKSIYRDNPEHWGMAVSMGHLEYRADWETERTEITLDLFGDNFNVEFGTLYVSKEFKHLLEKKKREKEMEEF